MHITANDVGKAIAKQYDSDNSARLLGYTEGVLAEFANAMLVIRDPKTPAAGARQLAARTLSNIGLGE